MENLLFNTLDYREKIKHTLMQDIRLRVEQPVTHISPTNERRPIQLLSQISLSNSNDVGGHQLNRVQQSPSSEEDNSPTEMNNCRRLVDKPPLVKRLTMGMGLLRATEESRPLVNTTSSSINSGSSQTISDGYVNEAICEPEKLLPSRYADSYGQSLSVLDTAQQFTDRNEFSYKKKYFRETCSANSSPKLFPSAGSMCFEGLSRTEQNELKGAPWFQAGIPREISLEVLSRQNPGAFLVRESTTKPGCFALSLRVPPPAPKVAHYLILRSQRGYKIKGFTKEFSSLRALITHHSVMPELLPIPLTLPRPNANSTVSLQNGNEDSDTYGSLNDFRKMMTDWNV
uniref:SH2 domain-containing protein n=1 Tax=Glossina pallidipes TaxID=7398 RepID=A0A1B0A6I8_GLOPL